REQQGHATSGGRLVSTRKVRMRPEHLACSVLQYGPPAETIEAQAHQNTCGGAGGRISDRNNMWGLHCARLSCTSDTERERPRRNERDIIVEIAFQAGVARWQAWGIEYRAVRTRGRWRIAIRM